MIAKCLKRIPQQNLKSRHFTSHAEFSSVPALSCSLRYAWVHGCHFPVVGELVLLVTFTELELARNLIQRTLTLCVCVCAHVHPCIQQLNYVWQNFPGVKVRLPFQCQRQELGKPLSWRPWYSAGKWDTQIAVAWSHIKGSNMPRPLTILVECSPSLHFQWKAFKAGRPSFF